MTEDDWSIAPPRGHPVIAMLAGGAVLVLAALLGPRLLGQQPMPALLMGGAALGLVLWILAWALTVRRSAALWQLGSLALLVAAGIGAGLVAHGQYQTRARADASSFAELELGPDGTPRLPSDAVARGPISRLFAESVQANANEQRDLAAALGKFGLAALNSPYLLAQNPHAIEHCGDLADIRTLAEDQARHRAERTAALRRAIGVANLPAQAKRGIAMMVAAPGGDPLLANQKAMLEATGELCALLKKRGWFNDGGYFGFRSAADRAAFDALKRKRQAIARETDAIDKVARERIAAGRETVRDALSRSIYAGG